MHYKCTFCVWQSHTAHTIHIWACWNQNLSTEYQTETFTLMFLVCSLSYQSVSPPPCEFKGWVFENIILFPAWHEQACTVLDRPLRCIWKHTHTHTHRASERMRGESVKTQSVGERLLDKRTVTVSTMTYCTISLCLSVAHIQPFYWNGVVAYIRAGTSWNRWFSLIRTTFFTIIYKRICIYMVLNIFVIKENKKKTLCISIDWSQWICIDLTLNM